MAANVAAGFIIYRRMDKVIEYLLLQTSYGIKHWTPPKGHLDPGETELEAAIRETEEEAGLLPGHYKTDEQFKEVLQYAVKNKPKTVHYWLAELKDPTSPVVLSDEHINFNWGDLATTKRLSNFEEMNRTFDRVHEFLTKR